MSQRRYGKIPVTWKAPLLKQHYVVFLPQNDVSDLLLRFILSRKGEWPQRGQRRGKRVKRKCKNELKIIIRKVEKQKIGGKVGKKVDVDHI